MAGFAMRSGVIRRCSYPSSIWLLGHKGRGIGTAVRPCRVKGQTIGEQGRRSMSSLCVGSCRAEQADESSSFGVCNRLS